MFYLLTILLTALHLQYMIWFFGEIINQWIYALILMPILKINMGVDQCWIMYELSLRIQLNIDTHEEQQKDQLAISHDEWAGATVTERKIKYGRRVLTTLIVSNVAGIMAYLVYLEVTVADPGER